MGICTVEYDAKSMVYITRPFNFYVRPIVKKGVGIIREFAVESDGMLIHWYILKVLTIWLTNFSFYYDFFLHRT